MKTKIKYAFATLFIAIILLAANLWFKKSNPGTITANPVERVEHTKITLIIQPFLGLSKATISQVACELQKLYSGKVIVKKPIPLPTNTFNYHKTRYRADSLIHYLKSTIYDNQLVIGLTNKDISTTKGEHADWGVMGLGFCPGKSCIASTFRLKGKNKSEKLFKVAIHELGHTQGLPHCPIKTCLMRDAEGKDRLNELTNFCPKCKSVLIDAGWMLH